MDIYFDYTKPDTVNTNEQAINNSIRNILTTQIGSVPGKPTFGSDLQSLIFEFIDGITEDAAATLIVEALNRWEPRITVLDVEVKSLPEYNKIVSTISYQYELLGKNVRTKTSIQLKD